MNKPTFAQRHPFYMTPQATRELLALRRGTDPIAEAKAEQSSPAPLFVHSTMDGSVERIELSTDFGCLGPAEELQAEREAHVERTRVGILRRFSLAGAVCVVAACAAAAVLW